MRCEEARPLISAELDEELDAFCAAQLRTHLVDCAPCSTERDSLAATVRLLRALPETEPPPALRRRIGAALLDAERTSERRQPAWAWLMRPHAPGWAWGAALGATVAVVALLVPHHQERTRRVAGRPGAVLAVKRVLPVSEHSQSVASLEPRRVVPVSRKHLSTTLGHALPSQADDLIAVLPSRDSSLAAPAVPSVTPAAIRMSAHRRLLHGRAMRRLVASPHHASPAKPGPLALAKGAPPHSVAPSDRSVRSSDDSVRQVRSVPPASTDPSTPQTADQDPQADTSGMTKMASDMPAPQDTGDDDLTELRRRLIDRPLQVPELGQLKPANSPHPNRDGWIRF
jgi:hypothetical protein